MAQAGYFFDHRLMSSVPGRVRPGRDPTLQPGVRTAAVVMLMLAAFGISLAYGMLLLLPLYVQDLGGNEADFGLVLASAAVTAGLSLAALTVYPEAVRPHWVLALAIGAFGIGSTGAALVTGGWEPLVGVGVLLGTAWALVYTVAPMVINEMVTDSGRTTYFGYLTGSEQLGIGAGPVLAGFLADTSVGLRGTFTIAGVVCAVSVIGTLVIGLMTPDGREKAKGSQRAPLPGLVEAAGRIFRSQAVLWLVIIALFACLFTAMTQFQTTFAAAEDLDYSVFYVTYTIAVIVVRFVGAPWAARFDPAMVIAVSISVMALAVASFLFVGDNPVAYATASAVMGLGYGLALPAAQAQAVNVSADSVRPRVLPIAGLVFQTAILAFPLAVGWIVVTFDYWLLFALLTTFAVLQAALCWWRVSTERDTARISSPGS